MPRISQPRQVVLNLENYFHQRSSLDPVSPGSRAIFTSVISRGHFTTAGRLVSGTAGTARPLRGKPCSALRRYEGTAAGSIKRDLTPVLRRRHKQPGDRCLREIASGRWPSIRQAHRHDVIYLLTRLAPRSPQLPGRFVPQLTSAPPIYPEAIQEPPERTADTPFPSIKRDTTSPSTGRGETADNRADWWSITSGNQDWLTGNCCLMNNYGVHSPELASRSQIGR